MSFDYDRWLESPYTDVDEGHEHMCEVCEGQGTLWLEDEQRFDPTQVCDDCKGESVTYCWEDCYDDPDYYEENNDQYFLMPT